MQGSILGPIICLLYINYIKNCTTSKLVSSADDTTIYYSSPNQNDLFQKINEELIQAIWLVMCKQVIPDHLNAQMKTEKSHPC